MTEDFTLRWIPCSSSKNIERLRTPHGRDFGAIRKKNGVWVDWDSGQEYPNKAAAKAAVMERATREVETLKAAIAEELAKP